MKKTFKRLGAALLAMAMAVSVLCTGALAAGTNSITITTTSSGHSYEAYQVFTGTLATVDDKKVLSNIEWGTGVNNAEDALLTAVKAINLGTDEAKNEPFAQCTDAASVAKALSGKENDSDIVKAFAKVVSQHLGNIKTNFTENKTTADGDGNQTTTGYTASSLDAGYYLVKDADNSTGIDAFTNYILEVTDATNVTPKSGVPTVTKKVQNETANETTGKDATTANFGDTVKFTLTATLPDHYADYNKYALTFHDTMSSSLSYAENSVEVTYQKYKEENGEWVKDTAEGKSGTINSSNYTVTTNPEDKHTIDVVFTDVKSLTSDGTNKINLGAHDQIIVTYKATVQNTAGLGVNGNNTNKVSLEYSNNPNKDTDKGKTPEEVVKVYTFQMNVVKKNGTDENANALAGAKFVLATTKLTKAENETTTDVNVITTGDIETYKNNLVAVTAGEKPLYTVGGTSYEMEVSSDNNTKGQLNIKGLKDGTYYLYETVAPDGYNKLTEPIKIEITASKDSDVPNGKVSATLTGAATGTITEVNNGILDKVTVVNNAGSQLPSTGGMGTTLFYIIGGVLMAGAAVVLVIKKKRSSAE